MTTRRGGRITMTSSGATSAARGPAGALAAHLAWAVAAVIAITLDGLAHGFAAAHAITALAALAPVVAAFLLGARLGRPDGLAALLIVWGAAASMVFLSAGPWTGGAFAAWFAGPAAAGAATGPRRAAFEGAALGALAFLGCLALRGVGLAPFAGVGLDFSLIGPFTAVALAPFIAAALGAAAGREARRAGAAQRRAARTRALLNASPMLVLRAGPDGQVRDMAGAPEMDAPNAAPRRASEIADPDARPALTAALSRAARFGETADLSFRRAGRPWVGRITPLRGGDVVLAARPAPEVDAFAALAADRDDAERRAAASARFFASMSHELRTPLNAIIGFTDMMKSRVFGTLAPKYGEYVELVNESAEHLLALVGQILDFSKLEAGKFEITLERFDAREAVEATARLTSGLAEAKHIRFDVATARAPIPVDADPMALRQMLINLVSNAVKFTPEKGRVALSARVEDRALVFEVCDTGPGIAPQELDKIGLPFEQTETGKTSSDAGTGLGLAIVRALARLHGGDLEVESELGAGTAMRVRLPVLVKRDGGFDQLDARARLDKVRQLDWGRTASGGG